jgi:hypothetical protein
MGQMHKRQLQQILTVYKYLLNKRDPSVLAARTRLHSAWSVWRSTFSPFPSVTSIDAPSLSARSSCRRFGVTPGNSSPLDSCLEFEAQIHVSTDSFKYIQQQCVILPSAADSQSTGHAIFLVMEPEGSSIFNKNSSFHHVLLQFIQIYSFTTNLSGLLQLKIHPNNIHKTIS